LKPPSQFDGKPIGTPMDAKSPFHAGVTVGPDQIERMEQQRRLLNRAVKAAFRVRQDAKPVEQVDAEYQAFRARKKRADLWSKHLDKGRKIAWIVARYGVGPEDVVMEVEWFKHLMAKRRSRDRRRKRRRTTATANAAASRISASTVDAISSQRGSTSRTGHCAPDAVTGE
jgi:hypothetical protein